jgi:hypothetical protein
MVKRRPYPASKAEEHFEQRRMKVLMRRNLAGAICAAIGLAALAQAEP